jgi:hypothetical protein
MRAVSGIALVLMACRRDMRHAAVRILLYDRQSQSAIGHNFRYGLSRWSPPQPTSFTATSVALSAPGWGSPESAGVAGSAPKLVVTAMAWERSGPDVPLRRFLRFSVAFEQVGSLEYEPIEWRQVSGVGNTIHHLADNPARGAGRPAVKS